MKDDWLGLGALGIAFLVPAAIIAYAREPDTTDYCRDTEPGIMASLVGTDSIPTCRDTILDQAWRIRQLEADMRGLQGRAETMQTEVGDLNARHESLRRTFNGNVEIDNRRNDAVNDRMDRVRTRLGECGYELRQVSPGVFQNAPVPCDTRPATPAR